MMHNNIGETRKTLVMFAYILVLLLSVPFMWKLEVFLRARHLLMITVYTLLSLYLVIVVILFFRYTQRKIAPALILIAYAALYAVIIIQAKGFDKKIHFIEYGILSFLVYDALARRIAGWIRYAAVFLIAGVVGFMDEGLQHFIPGRSFDPNDFISNVEASALMLLLLFIVERYRVSEKSPSD
jgi:hypothetical protein